MRVLILTNGDYGDYSFCDLKEGYDYVICADNGMHHAKYLGIVPDSIMGDFDSCNQEELDYFEKLGVSIKKVSSMKDETDTELAVDTAIAMGATQIALYGGIGTRMDHSLGNVHLLRKALNIGVKMWIINEHNAITLIDDHIRLVGTAGQTISLLPLTLEVTGICTKGLAYGLTRGILTIGKPVGVSNEMLGDQAEVTIETGLLLVMKTKD